MDDHQESAIQIACSSSVAYLPYCAAMLHGVLHRNESVTVHFLHGPALDQQPLSMLGEMVGRLGGSFVPHLVDEARLSGLPTLSYISEWYRILLPDLVPGQRVLYLDCDILVVDSLQPLWEIDLSGYYLAAVNGVPASGLEDSVRAQVADGAYLNSGVLLMNLEAMRADLITERLAKAGRAQAGRVQRSDQDILNLVLVHQWLPLHPRWNCQNTLFSPGPRVLEAFTALEIEEATANPAIVHFEGPGNCKPWHFLSDHPWTAAYREALASTPWATTPLQGRTLRNRLLAATLPPERRISVYARIELYKHRLGLPSDVW